MKYVCDVCGWEYDEEKDIQKEESLQEQNGKMFQKILNVHYVLQGKINFQKNNFYRYIVVEGRRSYG